MFSAADLPLTLDGRVYHLQLRPEDLASGVILVGDPERVPLIAESALESCDVDVSHRGLRTITGRTRNGLRITVTTSGMGTPSLEIVLQELAILNEIDFRTRERRRSCSPLVLIRVGTSGALRASTPLGVPIVTEYAVGLDNTGLFYDVPAPDDVARELETQVHEILSSATNERTRFGAAVVPYAARASDEVLSALEAAALELSVPILRGITVSNAGFFAPQGRDICRVRPTLSDLDRAFADALPRRTNLRFENMEMEASFLLHLAAGLEYPAAVLCPAVANRAEETFATDVPAAVRSSAAVAVRALELILLK